jgi:hypothetical protein
MIRPQRVIDEIGAHQGRVGLALRGQWTGLVALAGFGAVSFRMAKQYQAAHDRAPAIERGGILPRSWI